MSILGSLAGMFSKVLQTGGGRFLAKYGFKFGAAAGMTVLVTTALALVVTYTNALTSETLNFLLLCGFGQALNIIGAAMIAKSAIDGKLIKVISSR